MEPLFHALQRWGVSLYNFMLNLANNSAQYMFTWDEA